MRIKPIERATTSQVAEQQTSSLAPEMAGPAETFLAAIGKKIDQCFAPSDSMFVEPVIAGGATASEVTQEMIEAALAVNGAARRQYLGMPPDEPGGIMAKVTPFLSYEVVEGMTQVRVRLLFLP